MPAAPGPAARRRLAGSCLGQREETALAGEADGRTVLGKAGDDRFSEPARLGLDGTHLVKHLASGGPVARVLSQAAPDQLSQFGGHAAKVRGAVDQPVHERGVRPGTERSLACGGEGEHRAQAEQVAGRADIRAQGLFGGHEPRRADPQVGARGYARLGGLGNPEVDDPRPIFGQQHVGRFKVTMHDTGGVDSVQALRQPGGQRQQRAHGKGSVLTHRLAQRGPGDVRRGQPRHRAVQVRVDHQRGEQAAYLPGGRDLLPEPGPELRVRGQFGPDDLDGDGPAPRGHAQEHLSHATAAQLTEQLVGPDLTWVLGL